MWCDAVGILLARVKDGGADGRPGTMMITGGIVGIRTTCCQSVGG